ncbi:MAG: hypothetical protein J5881_03245 [Clostridia bacterium]|nr:hypothetical protein [Clostridia bacterium]
MASNFDERTMNNIKNMVDSGNLQGAISQISPEMIENFSKMMNNNSSPKQSSFNNSTYKKKPENSSSSGYNTNIKNNAFDGGINNDSTANNSGFDFSNIDMNTLMKMQSVMKNMNNKNDPSYNLLNSLKPYLRESRQEKIDQYANLLNFSKIAEAFNNSNQNPN